MVRVSRTYSMTQLVVYLAVLLLWGAAISLSTPTGGKNENDVRRKSLAHAEFHIKRDAYLRRIQQ